MCRGRHCQAGHLPCGVEGQAMRLPHTDLYEGRAGKAANVGFPRERAVIILPGADIQVRATVVEPPSAGSGEGL